MTAKLFSFLLLAVLSAGVRANPCATGGSPFPLGEGSGMGGTGLQADRRDGSGMGGTGHRDGSGTGGTGHRDGSGAGGTGQQAHTDGDGSGAGGTGVVGVITGFGSICVNELEIHYDAKTPVSMNGQSSRADQLAVGQMVAVRAEGKGGNLQAKHIQVRHTLVGRVETVSPDGQFRVWGQWVSPPLMSRVQTGERVKVSGYREDAKHVVASRIDPALASDPDVLSGEVEASQAGTALVSGVRIRLPEGSERLKPGQEIRVSGRPEAGGFRADRIEPDGLHGFMDRLDHLSVKDRIRPSGQPGKLRVGGVEFALDVHTRVKGGSARDLQPGRLVQVEARQKDGRAVVERIEIRSDAGERRHEKPDQGASLNRQGAATKEKHDASRASELKDRADGSRDAADLAGSERTEALERTSAVERSEKSEKIDKPEKPEAVEKAERIERIEKPEKVEKPEKPEKIERPEKVEKVERPEKPEKVERPEKPEIGD